MKLPMKAVIPNAAEGRVRNLLFFPGYKTSATKTHCSKLTADNSLP